LQENTSGEKAIRKSQQRKTDLLPFVNSSVVNLKAVFSKDKFILHEAGLPDCYFLYLNFFNGSAQKPAPTIPDFTFFRLDKTPFKNADLQKGKQLFFVFFDTECEHCQRAMTYLNGHYDDFKKAAIQLITLDSQEKLDAFFPKYGPALRGRKEYYSFA
jgi:hypothetical protein